MRAVIFDLDGTLVDSAPDIAHALNRFLAEQGQPAYDLPKVTSFIGHGALRLLEQAWGGLGIPRGAEALKADLARFEAIYAEDPNSRTRLYPGLPDALDVLRDRGFALGVCTNKPYALSVAVLETLGLAGYFGALIGGDSLPERKPSPEPLEACARRLGVETFETLYVGDSEVDAATAEAAGIPFLLHTEGYRKGSIRTRTLKAEFADFALLPELIAALVSET